MNPIYKTYPLLTLFFSIADWPVCMGIHVTLDNIHLSMCLYESMRVQGDSFISSTDT